MGPLQVLLNVGVAWGQCGWCPPGRSGRLGTTRKIRREEDEVFAELDPTLARLLREEMAQEARPGLRRGGQWTSRIVWWTRAPSDERPRAMPGPDRTGWLFGRGRPV